MTAPSLLKLLDRWAGPLVTLGTIIGGVIWLTTLHGIAEENQKDIQELRDIHRTYRAKVYTRLNNLDEKLAKIGASMGRLEGKIDMIVESARRDHEH